MPSNPLRAISRSRFRSRLSEPNYAIRSIASLVSYGIVAIAVSASALWPAVNGSGRMLAFTLPFAGFLLWALWVLMARPAMYYDAERVIVVNFAHAWVVPWFRVSGVEQRINLVVYLKDGTPIQAVGTPQAKRVYPQKAPFDLSSMPILGRASTSAPRVANTGLDRSESATLNEFASTAVDTGAPVERIFLRGSLITGAVLAALTAVSLVVDTLLG
ncbi:MAG TPA: hypothetical protein VK139_00515 [Microbacteriaceae bacterium]|nr:hypothetical protein [Microbacteriaceae bacterium]